MLLSRCGFWLGSGREAKESQTAINVSQWWKCSTLPWGGDLPVVFSVTFKGLNLLPAWVSQCIATIQCMCTLWKIDTLVYVKELVSASCYATYWDFFQYECWKAMHPHVLFLSKVFCPWFLDLKYLKKNVFPWFY